MISLIQPTFEYVELLIKNNTQNTITITNISYGNTGIQITEDSSFSISSEKETEKKFHVTLNNEKCGVPIVYYLKPKIVYEINGEKKQTVFENISKEAFYGEENDIVEYLYKKNK